MLSNLQYRYSAILLWVYKQGVYVMEGKLIGLWIFLETDYDPGNSGSQAVCITIRYCSCKMNYKHYIWSDWKEWHDACCPWLKFEYYMHIHQSTHQLS